MIMLITLAAALVACSGCGPIYGIFIGPLIPEPTVPAEYDMAGQNVLIWIDDSGLTKHAPTLRRELTLQISRELQARKAVGSTVDYDQVVRFRQTQSNLAGLTTQQLGEMNQADAVLYILVNTLNMQHEAGEGYYDTRMTGYSKVVASASGQRVWPSGQTYKPFETTQKFSTGSGPEYERGLLKKLCKDVSVRIVLPFYEHPEVE
ncbi:MAG: hypothetical protein K9M57_07280 [Phycisphaerae bacterium]|nr:hypothetical protein [Phycisphaerae bacterium]